MMRENRSSDACRRSVFFCVEGPFVNSRGYAIGCYADQCIAYQALMAFFPERLPRIARDLIRFAFTSFSKMFPMLSLRYVWRGFCFIGEEHSA